MATEDKSAQRIKENRDPSFTATPVKENLHYLQKILIFLMKIQLIRNYLFQIRMRVGFNLHKLLAKTLPIFIKKDKMIYN